MTSAFAPNDTDETLARHLQRGSRRALDMLVERHYDSLVGFLYRMTSGDRALALDFAQETFLRALRHIDQFQPDRRFKPWLYAIALNLVRGYFASAHVCRAADVDTERLPAPDPFDPLADDEDARAVIAALAALPAHQREVIALFYYQSFSYDEIAAALGIPVGTVKSRLSLAVKRLRAWMKENHDESIR